MSPYPGSQKRGAEGGGAIKAFRSGYEWGDSFVTWVGGGAGEEERGHLLQTPEQAAKTRTPDPLVLHS